jgi:hypothetical protein
MAGFWHNACMNGGMNTATKGGWKMNICTECASCVTLEPTEEYGCNNEAFAEHRRLTDGKPAACGHIRNIVLNGLKSCPYFTDKQDG